MLALALNGTSRNIEIHRMPSNVTHQDDFHPLLSRPWLYILLSFSDLCTVMQHASSLHDISLALLV